MEGEAKREMGEEEKHIHCFAYMDKSGRILVPLRNREEAGIAGIAGADVELNLVVKKVYRKKEEERRGEKK